MKKNLLFIAFISITSFVTLSLSVAEENYWSQIAKSNDNRAISGLVKDKSGEPINGASINITGTKKGTITDFEGEFNLIIDKNVKTLSVFSPGYEITEVNITEENYYKVILKEAEILDEVVVSDFTKKMRRSISSSPVSTTAMPSKAAEVDYSGYVSDYPEAEPTLSKEVEGIRKSEPSKAGTLTAGEWNDLYHWEKWEELINEADYKEMGGYWKVYPRNRVTVYAGNQYELPLSDCEVIMESKDGIIWRTKTDNSGKAELWFMEGQVPTKIKVRSGRQTKTIDKVKNIHQGVNRIFFEKECVSSPKADIMFVVDATGSMGDEISFLKSELNDVIDKVEKNRDDVSFRWGSVFYRDESDEYLTRQLPLTTDAKKLMHFISEQDASGGGDYPEAVTDGLEEALIQEWSSEAIARIIFLVLDAPPHHNSEKLITLQNQIELASAMGIKIIPITASGINRQTEYLMKFMSIMTNGTYVFLTDDSGVGNSHLEHITKDYSVEKLNDLLIRLIINYTDMRRCIDQNEVDPLFVQTEFSPNPVIDILNVKAPKGTKMIRLISNSGQLIKEIEAKGEGRYEVNMTSYIDGMYLLQLMLDSNHQYTYKIIKSGARV
jgi:hypothetical protein